MASLIVRTGLGPFREQWDALVSGHYPPCAHLRSWWLEGIADASSRFLLVADGDRLLGGLAVDARKVAGPRTTTVELLGGPSLGPLHADILAVAGHEETVVEWLGDWFRSYNHCIVDLDAVRLRPRLLQALPGAQMEQMDEAPVIRLPDTFEDYLAQRSRNWRSNLRRNTRRLEAEGFVHRTLRAEEFDLAIDSLRRLHTQRHDQRSGFLPHFGRFVPAARAGLDRDELCFHVIASDDEIVAIDVIFEVGDYATYFQGGRNTEDPRYQGAGLVLLAKVIEDACKKGLRELDLEVSADEYKLRMTDEVRPVQRLAAVWGYEARWYLRLIVARGTLRSVRKRAGKLARRFASQRRPDRGAATAPPHPR